MSLDFSAASNGLTIGGLALSSSQLCLAGWLKVTAATGGTGPAVLHVRDNNTTGKTAGIGMDGVLGTTSVDMFTPTTGGTGITTPMFTATLNKWYFIAMTINGTTFTAYWSQAGGGGVLNTTNTTDATAITSYSDFWAGSDDSSNLIPGVLAAVSIWSGASALILSTNLQNQMLSQKPVFTPGLFAQYPMFAQGDGNKDFSGNGHNLTYPVTKPTTDVGPPCSWAF